MPPRKRIKEVIDEFEDIDDGCRLDNTFWNESRSRGNGFAQLLARLSCEASGLSLPEDKQLQLAKKFQNCKDVDMPHVVDGFLTKEQKKLRLTLDGTVDVNNKHKCVHKRKINLIEQPLLQRKPKTKSFCKSKFEKSKISKSVCDSDKNALFLHPSALASKGCHHRKRNMNSSKKVNDPNRAMRKPVNKSFNEERIMNAKLGKRKSSLKTNTFPEKMTNKINQEKKRKIIDEELPVKQMCSSTKNRGTSANKFPNIKERKSKIGLANSCPFSSNCDSIILPKNERVASIFLSESNNVFHIPFEVYTNSRKELMYMGKSYKPLFQFTAACEPRKIQSEVNYSEESQIEGNSNQLRRSSFSKKKLRYNKDGLENSSENSCNLLNVMTNNFKEGGEDSNEGLHGKKKNMTKLSSSGPKITSIANDELSRESLDGNMSMTVVSQAYKHKAKVNMKNQQSTCGDTNLSLLNIPASSPNFRLCKGNKLAFSDLAEDETPVHKLNSSNNSCSKSYAPVSVGTGICRKFPETNVMNNRAAEISSTKVQNFFNFGLLSPKPYFASLSALSRHYEEKPRVFNNGNSMFVENLSSFHYEEDCLSTTNTPIPDNKDDGTSVSSHPDSNLGNVAVMSSKADTNCLPVPSYRHLDHIDSEDNMSIASMFTSSSVLSKPVVRKRKYTLADLVR